LPSAEAEVAVEAFELVPLQLPAGLPKLFLNGRDDTLSPEADVTRYVDGVTAPCDVQFVAGAAHMFDGKEAEAAGIALAFVRRCGEIS